MQRADCGLVTRRSLLPVSNRFHLNPYLLSFIWTLPMNLELLFKCLIPSFPRFASTFLTIQPRPWHCRGQGFDPPRLHQIFQLDLNCSQIGKSVNACLSHLGSLTSNSTTTDPFMMVGQYTRSGLQNAVLAHQQVHSNLHKLDRKLAPKQLPT